MTIRPDLNMVSWSLGKCDTRKYGESIQNGYEKIVNTDLVPHFHSNDKYKSHWV